MEEVRQMWIDGINDMLKDMPDWDVEYYYYLMAEMMKNRTTGTQAN